MTSSTRHPVRRDRPRSRSPSGSWRWPPRPAPRRRHPRRSSNRPRPSTPATVWSSTASRSPTSRLWDAADAEGSINLYTGYTENTEAAAAQAVPSRHRTQGQRRPADPEPAVRADLRRVRRRQTQGRRRPDLRLRIRQLAEREGRLPALHPGNRATTCTTTWSSTAATTTARSTRSTPSGTTTRSSQQGGRADLLVR